MVDINRIILGCCACICCSPIFLCVFWILFMPNGPRDPEFQVDSAFISSLNSTTPSELTATWDVTLLAINPNHNVSIHYDVVQVWLYYGRTKYSTLILTTSLLPPFVLNSGNQTRVNVKLATLRAYVGDDEVKNITGADGGSTTAFGLKVFIRYRLMTEAKTVRGPWSDRYFCNEVKIRVSDQQSKYEQ